MKTSALVCYSIVCALLLHFSASLAAKNSTENAVKKTEETDNAEEAEETFEETLNSIFPKKYDKDTRPLRRNSTFNIDVSVHIYDLNRVMFSDFLEIYVTLKLTQFWTEHRLKPFPKGFPNLSSLVVPKAHQERFWRPDTGFGLDDELKTVYELLEVHSNRTVNLEQYVVTKVYCPVEYTLFPMDQPNCTLTFGSNADLSLRYTWKADHHLSLQFDREILLPGVTALGYTRRGPQLFEGYACLLVDIFLERRLFFYLARFYLPAFFVVVIAFLPLYLTPDSHARVGLGVSSVLTMTMLLSSASADLPNIGQLTFLDIYLFFCFFAVFLSVVEYALIGYYDVVRSREEEIADKNRDKLSRDEDKMLRKIELAERRSTTVDLLSRQLFPASFALFNVVYAVVCVCIYLYNGRAFVEYKV